ncbi:hypothetical protein KXV58_002641 [Aspergillus fumigatus]|nr:hypothetical protein CNMCM8057_002332 [Aspergillus fumigatus]KAF4284483.1 hypothetical protein CNMCM8686_005354 [Aspergillus fumigatus]KAH1311217.1 hypothetical protein KXX38_005919 [Aspergillus fumigatus]KAH1448805.1 hypothetical protein KXX58_005745 [Aspergillus fumigatus]KAH2002503.1 hypothetical protein KXV45_002970 [Aspergillus fumigatus]
MVDATHSTAPVGSDTGVRKFTLSCSRCRASKLKCDRKEPCMECVKRNIGHLCTKDERQPRAKRSKIENKDKTPSKRDPPPNGDGEAEAEETAQLLEHFVEGVPRPNAYRPAVLGPTPSSVAPDFPNPYWSSNDPKRHGEKLALIREIVDAMPTVEIIDALLEVFITRCQGPLGNVVHTPTFLKQAQQFSNCLKLASLDSRVLAVSSTVPMEKLGGYLLALVLGLAFHPTPSLLGWTPTPLTLRVEELRASEMHSKTWRSLGLRCLQDGVSLFCGSIASLQAAIMLLLDGQENSLALDAVLVTAISGARKLGLHRLGGIKLDASASPVASLENDPAALVEPDHIRTEIAIRIWWALVLRDWSRGQALGYYTIHPSQFNTRMPLHINDDDLCPSAWRVTVNGEITERPRSEFTMMSYTVHALELAGIVRESIDLRGAPTQQPDGTAESAKLRRHINNKYEKYIATLPSYFRLGSTVGLTATGPMAAIPVQRWMLHQQLWSLLLRLHRADLSSPISRASCQLLAQNIVSTQAQIQARCAVCGSLSTSETQLFNAAVVLLLDLLFSSKQGDGDSASAHLSRLMTRDKIREAIELLRTKSLMEGSSLHDLHLEQVKGSAQRSVVALEALMKLEEGDFDHNGTNSSNSAAGNRTREPLAAKDSLRLRITDILRDLSGRADPEGAPVQEPQAPMDPLSPFQVSMPFANVPDGFHDLDVLPILSNGLSPNFWQFLDFPPPPFDSHPKEVSLATQGDPPGAFGLGPSQFPDSYSSTPSTRMTHTSPSLQSESIGLGGGSDSATTPSSADAYVAAKFYYAMGDGTLAPM